MANILSMEKVRKILSNIGKYLFLPASFLSADRSNFFLEKSTGFKVLPPDLDKLFVRIFLLSVAFVAGTGQGGEEEVV